MEFQEHKLQETWQVEVGGAVYEAQFAELPDWISEGSLQPDDKVRRGNLRWIEARKVPQLVPFFNAKAKGEPLPVVVTETKQSAEPDTQSVTQVSLNAVPEPLPVVLPATASIKATKTSPNDNSHCINHADVPSKYVCSACETGFCKACPRSYGGSVRICPACGELCRDAEAVAAARVAASSDALGGDTFGFGDLGYSFGHPFRFGTSLVFGGILYTFLSLGQSAAGIGGIVMVATALIAVMATNAISFGVLANTVDNFSKGAIDSNFMPDFEDFSIWEDVVHPFFLSLAAYISSFGPFILAAIIGVYLIFSAVSSKVESINADLERIPGTHYYSQRDVAEQSTDVKRVLTEIADGKDEQIGSVIQPSGEPTAVVDEDAREQEELWAMAQEHRKAQLESVVGPSPETRDAQFQEFLTGFLQLAAPLVVILMLTFLWGLILYPAACAVAGYTRSFMATINPATALNTIRHLGFDYVKLLLFGLLLTIFSGIVIAIPTMLLTPFDMPGVGNLPAKAVGAFIGFYFWAVYCCLIGLMLFRNREKLALPS
ncbi:MAG: hypothetical protein IPM21_16635 [Acidobacteria bacterium]|nr:hypothetical protein [Acidobacteriota bacterium]